MEIIWIQCYGFEWLRWIWLSCFNFFKFKSQCSLSQFFQQTLCLISIGRCISDCKFAMYANCFHEIKNIWFMILAAGTMVREIDQMWHYWTDSKAVVITAWEICVFRQKVPCKNWHSNASQETLVTIQVGIFFVWYPFVSNSLWTVIFSQFWNRYKLLDLCLHVYKLSFLLASSASISKRPNPNMGWWTDDL